MSKDWVRSIDFLTKSSSPKRLYAKDLPSTQDSIEIAAAQDNVLVLRDGDVVAAVGFASVSDALFSQTALEARLATYRNLLKSLRFDVQLLIGTRPQNLSAYTEKMQRARERIGQLQIWIDTLTTRLAGYLQRNAGCDETIFGEYFGFNPSDLLNTPDGIVDDQHDGAHSVAQQLSNPDDAKLLMDSYLAAEVSERRQIIDRLVRRCDLTSITLQHWQAVINDRSKHVQLEVELLRAPVRTYFFVTAHNPRVVIDLLPGPLTLDQLDRAKSILDQRCADLAHGLRQMRLPHWRATHVELLEDIRRFYNPMQSQLNPTLHAERSVAMRLASVR